MRHPEDPSSFDRIMSSNAEDNHRKDQSRHSLDTLIIPRRTRVPSRRPEVPKAVLSETRDGRSKLKLSISNVRAGSSCTSPQRRDSESRNLHQLPSSVSDYTNGLWKRDDSPADKDELEARSRLTSATWSTISNRVISYSSGRSADRDPTGFIGEFNRLASCNGLSTLEPYGVEDQDRQIANIQPPPLTRKTSLFRRILRRASSTYSITHGKHNTVGRKLSFGDVANLRRLRKDTLKNKGLDELARVIGVSVVDMPTEFSPGRLAIPTCLAATATYLFQHGRRIAGLFRVPGQLGTVNAIYDYYGEQFLEAQRSAGQIQLTVAKGQLPSHINFTVHDVASAFKKFVSGIPGGLLGSLSLFNTFREISVWHCSNSDISHDQQRIFQAKLIAYAIASSKSEHRLALICVVLGVAASIAKESLVKPDQNMDGQSFSKNDLMGYEALGVVLGPLLLGDLTEYLKLTNDKETATENFSSKVAEKGRKENRKILRAVSPKKTISLSIHFEQAKAASRIMEFLIRCWEEVVIQLRSIDAFEGHRHLSQSSHRYASNRNWSSISTANGRSYILPSVFIQFPSNARKSHQRRPGISTTSHELEQYCPEVESQTNFNNDVSGHQDDQSFRERDNTADDTNNAAQYLRTGGRSASVKIAKSPRGHFSVQSELTQTDAPGEEKGKAKMIIAETGPRLDEYNIGKIIRNSPKQLLAQLQQEVTQNGGAELTQNGTPSTPVRQSKPSQNLRNKAYIFSAVDSRHSPSGKFTTTPEDVRDTAGSPHSVLPRDGDEARWEPRDGQISPVAEINEADIRNSFELLPNEGIPVRNSSLGSPVGHADRAQEALPSSLDPKAGHAQSLDIVGHSYTRDRGYTIKSPDFFQQPISPNDEGPVVRRIDFRDPGEWRGRQSNNTSQNTLGSRGSRENYTTMYAELRRLQRQLEVRSEEAVQTKRQLDAMRDFKGAGTLTDQLRESQRELNCWKNRAEWAERRLMAQETGKKRSRACRTDGTSSEADPTGVEVNIAVDSEG